MERIICSAIWVQDTCTYSGTLLNIPTGVVIGGRKHKDCLSALVGLPQSTLDGSLVFGFITTGRRFLDRIEAYKIAYEAGQIVGPNSDTKENEWGLTSEDIFGMEIDED